MINLFDYGYTPTENVDGIPARVTAQHKERYELICEHGQASGRLKTSVYYGNDGKNFPTVGDFVEVDSLFGDECRIIRTLPRRSFFSRLDPSSSGHAAQAVAANFDFVFILQSLNQDFNPRRLERYLTLAWQSGGIPVVILTKADLTENWEEQLYQVKKIAANTAVFAVSAKTGFGMEALNDYVKPQKTLVFLGSSGVGKSSLVNALAGDDLMAVSGIREDDDKGRHTTTHRQLILLPNGALVIDTPGMREIGMWDVTEGMGQSFADVEQYFCLCKFKDCGHNSEPGCAVRSAIERGDLPAQRWESYNSLKNEATYADDKSNYLRMKQQRHKQIAKFQRNNKKIGRYDD